MYIEPKTRFKFSIATGMILTGFIVALLTIFPPTKGGALACGEQNNIPKGSIQVCKMIVDKDGKIVVGNFPFSTLTLEGLAPTDVSGRMDGLLPTTEWNVGNDYVLNADMNADGINDSNCTTYSGLALGSYYYAQESISGVSEDWGIPLYNDHASKGQNEFSEYVKNEQSGNDDEHEDNAGDNHKEGDDNHNGGKIGDKQGDEEGFSNNHGDETHNSFGGSNEEEGDSYGNKTDDKHGEKDESDDSHGNAKDESEDDTSDVNGVSDGVITISEGNETATLIVLNTYKVVPTSTVCSDGIDNDNDGVSDKADPACHTDGNAGNDDSYDENIDDENSNPIAVLSLQETSYVGTAITLDGTASHDVDGTIASYTWNFGDGSVEVTTTAPASTTVHTYTVAGKYTATLKVTDNKGAVSEVATKIIEIKVVSTHPKCSDGIDNDNDGVSDKADPACHTDGNAGNDDSYDENIDDENSAPIAVLAIPSVSYINTMIVLDGTASHDVDGTIASYTWNFGDNSAEITTTAPASTTPHTYTTIGTYTAKLKVTDNKGAVSEVATKTIEIKTIPVNPKCSDGVDNDNDGLIDKADPACHTDGKVGNDGSYDKNIDNENALPIAVLSVNPDSSKINTSVSFTGTESYDLDGTIVLYEWNFGDGVVATTTVGTTSHTYSTVDTYTVKLVVTDNNKATSTPVTKTVSITNPSNGGGGGGGGCSGNCGGGGSTGGGSGAGAVLLQPTTTSLVITNETLQAGSVSGTSLVKWTTNIPSDSRVVYGNSSVTSFPIGDEKYGYSKTTDTVSELVTSHSMSITGIDSNLSYYFRPVSRTTSLSATGKELASATNGCYYLRDFLKYGNPNNDPTEVKKLQAFLNEFDGANLLVSGYFDLKTLDAVNVFQTKYKINVLDPWGYTDPTGYVYLTTRKQVNEIYCRAAFPLNGMQSAEVDAFRALLARLRTEGIMVPTQEGTVANQQVGQGAGLVNGVADVALSVLKGEGKTPELTATSAPASSVTDRGTFRNMIAGAYGSLSDAIASYWILFILIVLLAPTGFYARKMLREEDGELGE